MIDMKKQYKTQNNRAVEIYTTSAKGLHFGRTVIGLVEGDEYPHSWMPDGKDTPGSKSSYDLIEVKPVREGWVNIERTISCNAIFTTSGNVWPTKEEADRVRGRARIACIKITFTEGEGL